MDAMERAIYYLNIKPRTKRQMIQYLTDKGYKDDDIEEAVEKLEEYHYLDDFSYCQSYFELGFEKGRGLYRIKRELADKGVDRDIIDKALDEMDDIPDQRELALKIAKDSVIGMNQEEITEMTFDDKQKLQAKIARRLSGRGFSKDIVYSVVRELVAI